MHNPDKPYELRNIKKNPSGYQVQYIIAGKSHSAFNTDLEKAKKIRDKMEKKFKVSPMGSFKRKYVDRKMSFIPGTNKPMAAGISLQIFMRHETETYQIIVNWIDATDKKRVKTFYGCSETRYTRKVMKAAYDRALAFRQAYEKAVLEKTLADFDPSIFNKKRASK